MVACSTPVLRQVDSGFAEFVSKCSLVEVINTKFNIPAPPSKDLHKKAIARKVSLGCGSSLEEIDAIFGEVRHLSIDVFCSDEVGYDKIPFL